ncbi:MAG: hypothetical protein IM671_13760 [Phenylobacterium sp.]|uniref:hypothetical protein n=1 Tax=Phenylobacterium sp. TaxID=1871053 RepID=UPI0025CD65E9|nr:hypothetical protein [Phenylobacterium sp.]MCA3750712.1 hypothetical protein [Phenylobacterium sp.]MCA6247775.1 hypothetical protein [Phenylobacterium sp.]MCA6253983.1 hypothetical protein [Phenylobacterium sp.]
MGIVANCLAVRAQEGDRLLGQVGAVRTGRTGDWSEAVYAGKTFGSGWYVLVIQGRRFDPDHDLAPLAAGREILHLYVDDVVMHSSAVLMKDGKVVWRVISDADEGYSEEGEPPAGLAPILAELRRNEAEQDPDEPQVDYVFDAPIEAAALVTGFRGLADTHDPALGAGFEWLEPPAKPPRVGLFTALAQLFGLGRKG